MEENKENIEQPITSKFGQDSKAQLRETTISRLKDKMEEVKNFTHHGKDGIASNGLMSSKDGGISRSQEKRLENIFLVILFLMVANFIFTMPILGNYRVFFIINLLLLAIYGGIGASNSYLAFPPLFFS